MVSPLSVDESKTFNMSSHKSDKDIKKHKGDRDDLEEDEKRKRKEMKKAAKVRNEYL